MNVAYVVPLQWSIVGSHFERSIDGPSSWLVMALLAVPGHHLCHFERSIDGPIAPGW